MHLPAARFLDLVKAVQPIRLSQKSMEYLAEVSSQNPFTQLESPLNGVGLRFRFPHSFRGCELKNRRNEADIRAGARSASAT